MWYAHGVPEMTFSSDKHPGPYVRDNVLPPRMSVTEAARLMGVGRPALSNFLNGRSSLSRDMAVRLERTFGAKAVELIALQGAHEAAQVHAQGAAEGARSFVPPFLKATADDIELWADRHSSRSRLAVFLRTLVHSTGRDLSKVDFPGNDDAERPGWDGHIEAATGTPWIPAGTSGWEFGTNKEPGPKATKDFSKSVKAVPKAERANMTFVFVTPRRWRAKGQWQKERRAEGAWKDVLVYDASDLEQWLEQSIPAQTWIAGEQGKHFRGTRSLDRCWTAWNADCEPRFTPGVFEEAKATIGKRILDGLKNAPERTIKVASDSRDEALAFLSVLFSTDDEFTADLRARSIVFEEPGPLSELASRSSRFLPIIADRSIEKELAQLGVKMGGIVIYPRNVVRSDADVTLEPLSHAAFDTALETMGLGRDEVDRLGHESGRSLTVLRRRLSRSEAIRRPFWSADDELADALVPFMLAGAWKATGDVDQFFLCHLAGDERYEQLESRFNRLLALEDPPTWAVGGFRGVISKLDALYAVRSHLTAADLDRFYEVAELVLSEMDPALELPEDSRWAASIYGKTRDVSAALREGINESLVLLSVHGRALFGASLGSDPQARSDQLVRKLLGSADTKTLESHARDLHLYAEAAPEAFLRLLEDDLRKAEPQVLGLMRPVSDVMFSSTPRTGLLWALEVLAWSPTYVTRVVDILARLAGTKIEDNLMNKPEATLASIFRSWMPQTGASLQQRIMLLDRLAQSHPAVAWPICVDQFAARPGFGHESSKPRWRDYALGHGEPSGEGHRAFVSHAAKLALTWPKHDRRTLADLVENLQSFAPGDQAQVWGAVDLWGQQASDEDRAWLRERIRVHTMTRRARRGRSAGLPAASAAMARRSFEGLEPRDLVQKHAWLFRDHWVEASLADLEADMDFDKRDKQVESERLAALSEVHSSLGLEGLVAIAKTGNAAFVVGRLASVLVVDLEERGRFAEIILSDGNVRSSYHHRALIGGFFHGLERSALFDIIEQVVRPMTPDDAAPVLSQAPFRRDLWENVVKLGPEYERSYWATVDADWTRDGGDTDVAVRRLLEANRPRVAFGVLNHHMNSVDPETLYTLLKQLAQSKEVETPIGHMEAYHIEQALAKLNESNAFSLEQMAHLELIYFEVLRGEDGRIPNLERLVEKSPGFFVEAISYVYRRDDGTHETDASADKAAAERAAQRAYRLLDALSRIPGTGDDGQIEAERLLAWIMDVQERCADVGQLAMCDLQVGKLLSHAPADDDGVWPCMPVRDVLDQVLTNKMESGLTTGIYNARGAHWRGEGGQQERDLAAKYEGWARAQEHTHPHVAAALRRLAASYLRQADWEDDEAGVRKRLRY